MDCPNRREIKILVMKRNGEQEVLALSGDWHTCQHSSGQNVLSNGPVDYFFCQDGHYDGWGRSVSEAENACGVNPGLTPTEN